MAGPRIAIIFQTGEGHTTGVAARIAAGLRANGCEPEIREIDAAPGTLEGFDGVVVGGSVHNAKHGKELAAWTKRHAGALADRPNAFFSVSITAAVHDQAHLARAGEVAESFFAQTGWHPDMVALLGGALLYTRYGWIKRFAMKQLAAHEFPGLTDTHRDYDLTDWDAVDHFARDAAAHMRAGAMAAHAV
ncbi:MAG: protoporphyrinogen oxidase [Dehalococcoidia bacterium]|nr:protoporphyrinogen oxidase [Dehalococcoidia bacterium]